MTLRDSVVAPVPDSGAAGWAVGVGLGVAREQVSAALIAAQIAAVVAEAEVAVEAVVAAVLVVELGKCVLDGSWLMAGGEDLAAAAVVLVEVLGSRCDCGCSAGSLRAASQWLGLEPGPVLEPAVAAAFAAAVGYGVALPGPASKLLRVAARLVAGFAFVAVVAGAGGVEED